MKKTLALAALCCLSFGLAAARQQPGQRPEGDIMVGTFDLPQGSPVQLANLVYVLQRHAQPTQKGRIADIQMTIENTGGRDIRLVPLKYYVERTPVRCLNTQLGASEVKDLQAGEKRVIELPGEVNKLAQGASYTIHVRVSGVEFADGTHWAAPRRNPLLAHTLHQPHAPLWINGLQLRGGGSAYEISLRAEETNIVAYRLGTVKDTTDGFEIRLGKWVEVNDVPTEKNGAISDTMHSLSPGELLPFKRYVCMQQEKEYISLGDAAFFVAGVKFADGRTWQQDTSRDGLLWIN